MSCNENILSLIPPSGKNGISSYTYVAYADDVTLGTPDVVTTFNANTPLTTSEWFAIINSSTPLTPLEANFQGHWAKFKGADGTGAAGINVKNNNVAISSNVTTLNFKGSGLSGVVAQDAGGNQTDITIVTAGLIKITRSNALIDATNNVLIPGASYWIYDVAEGADPCAPGAEYAGIILRAITVNKFSTSGIFIERNINRAVVNTKYALVNPDTFVLDDVVEYKNSVYQLIGNYTYVTTGDIATDLVTFNPEADTTNWIRITRDDNTYYTTSVGSCEYDIINDIIVSRSDIYGNTITCGDGNSSILTGFRWGNPLFLNNTINISADGDIDFSFVNSLKNNIIYNCQSIINPYDYADIDFYKSEIYNSNFTIDSLTTTSLSFTQCTIKNSTINSYCNGEVFVRSTFINTNFDNSNTDLSITDCTFDNSTIRTAGVFTSSSFFYSDVYGNSGSTSITGCHINQGSITANVNTSITYCSGSIKITSNTDSIINACHAVNTQGFAYAEISNNTGCNIYLNTIENVGKIYNNKYISIFDCTLHNGYINSNSNINYPTLLVANAQIGELRLSGESYVRNNQFVTSGRIVVGQLHGQYSYIENVIFDSVTYGISGITAVQGNIENFSLDNISIYGNSTGNANLYKTSPVNSVSTNAYDHMIANNNSSNFYGFLDMSTAFSAGVLSIPNHLQHCGEIWLYNCSGQTITSINKPSYAFNKLKFPITFKALSSNVIFQGTSGAVYPQIATDATGVSTGYTITGRSNITFKLTNGIYTQTNVNIIS